VIALGKAVIPRHEGTYIQDSDTADDAAIHV
jgi:hypothetical protein